MEENKHLSTTKLYMENVIERLKTKKTIQDEIDILWFLRNICRELQHYCRKDKKQSKAFADKAKIFQNLMTMKRKESRKRQK